MNAKVVPLPCQYVAPLAGAWIEIANSILLAIFVKVAPLAGAWIEIFIIIGCCQR